MDISFAIEKPDRPDVIALIALSDAAMALLYPPEGNFAVDLAALCRDDILFLVARRDGVAVGCGAVKWLGAGCAELKRIFVRNDARGTGLGRQILMVLQAEAENRGTKTLYLETGPKNIEAVSLYTALGYRQCGPFAHYEDNPHSLFMTKDLQPN